MKLWKDDGRTDGRRTDDGRTPDHGHPISSPCEPNGSGELKITDAFSDIKNITVDTLLNPSPAHAEISRAAVFDFIKETDYVKII